jgi:hypothetical protein
VNWQAKRHKTALYHTLKGLGAEFIEWDGWLWMIGSGDPV